MIMLTKQEKYNAILRKDSSFEGIFYTGVLTTKIFCRPTCTAKKPKPENVVFFDSAKEALQHGFRPCKICKPLEQPGHTPKEIQSVINEINENPENKIKDYHLRRRGMDPVFVRRWFKKNHEMTFHGFQRMVRINSAFNQIHSGESVTQTAYDSGFESLSGFNDSYKSIFGYSPTKSKGKSIINITRFSTPLGPMFACASDMGICLAEFTDRRMLETEFRDLRKRLNAVILPGPNEMLDQLKEQMMEYFDGSRQTFDLPLDTPGTPFQQSVWILLQKIPYGETVSYKQQAIKLKKPEAIRAVAQANGNNRVAIIIPCHRVIGENGNLTGYAGGLSRKKWLLDFERKNSAKYVQGEIEFENKV